MLGKYKQNKYTSMPIRIMNTLYDDNLYIYSIYSENVKSILSQ
jgi:hypothetical protein